MIIWQLQLSKGGDLCYLFQLVPKEYATWLVVSDRAVASGKRGMFTYDLVRLVKLLPSCSASSPALPDRAIDIN